MRVVTSRDGAERTESSSLSPHAKLHIDVFNLLNAHVSDIDYFYQSRLPGEPLQGISGIHSHAAEPRSFRAGVTAVF